ncbi:hypothetical protein ACXX81_23775 [Pseudomonas sp. GNP013]|uniref:hypothetical protein n=1 Tax=unclassified Pseudomonas TaxID=196821 RepID=UPI001E4F4414|nr:MULTISPECIES: hypothetical protein [unclassified Pseudomonas]MEB0107324.1 hypothetical protein [Pseudomonas sp. MH9.3]WPX77563.1 hypothetical protein RHM60_14990 [Pseudomonas sp. MH9.3]WQG59656.1 hypothetical protein RHM66_11605 [Pseudomonas sp. RTB3]
MSRLPPVGVLTCIRQVLSSLHLCLAKHRAPANILDARVFLFFASSIAITPQMTAAPIKITHKVGLRNATLQQMAGKLLP